MATIRPLERGDLPRVTALMHENLPEWHHEECFLADTLIDYPWADPELTSLVATDAGGEVIGFVSGQARRVKLDDSALRGVCVSHLVVAADSRAGAAGALLLSRMLSGPQDLSWSDSANDAVVRMWRAFGGDLDHSRGADWMLALRPARWVAGAVGTLARGRQLGREQVPVAAMPLQALGRRLASRAFPAPTPGVAGADASAAEIAANAEEIHRGIRFRVDHDEPHLEHLFARVEQFSGPVVHRIVRRDGRPVGWYAYLRPQAGVSRVLYLGCPEHEADAVLGDLIESSKSAGAWVLTGRCEPRLTESLRLRLAVLGFARQPVIHAKDPELRVLLGSSRSLLSQLDSEWYVP